MRILQLYYEPAVSGQTTHVLSLTRSLVRRGHQVEVGLPSRLREVAPSFRETGARVHMLEMRKVFWKPGAAIELVRLVQDGGFDIVHVHSQEAGLAARLLAYLGGAKKLVYTPQTIDIRQKRWQKLYAVVERLLASITGCVVSVNERDRQRLIDWGIPPSRLVRIYNGIDLTRFGKTPETAEIRKRLGICEDSRLIMQVGRLGAQKNPLAFVEGAHWVLERAPGCQFVMVGEGLLMPELERRIGELGLQDQIHLAGRVEDAWLLMAAADVVTLTSSWEGTPYSLLEAMAWSKPVVATDVNGCREVVVDGETGFLCPPGEVEAWGRLVLSLLEDTSRRMVMGQAGRRRVEKLFELESMVSQLETRYQSLLTDYGI